MNRFFNTTGLCIPERHYMVDPFRNLYDDVQRIVNGGGRIEREMALGNGRTDLVVFWREQVIPVELKMHHDQWSESDGLQQLSRYMDRLGQRRGYLVLFEKKSPAELPREQRIRRELHEVGGREVVLLGM